MWIFDGGKINFDKIMAFRGFCIMGYKICVINFFGTFQWIIFKLFTCVGTK